MVVSICITLCVCCFYLFFFEKGWIWRDDNKKYCIILKKDIYIYIPTSRSARWMVRGVTPGFKHHPFLEGQAWHLQPPAPRLHHVSGNEKNEGSICPSSPVPRCLGVIMCWVIRWFGANDCLSSKYGVRWVVSNSNIQGCWNIPFVSYCFTVLFILLMFNDVHGMFSKSVSLGIKPSTRWRTHMKQRFNEPQLCAMGPTRTDWSCNML